MASHFTFFPNIMDFTSLSFFFPGGYSYVIPYPSLASLALQRRLFFSVFTKLSSPVKGQQAPKSPSHKSLPVKGDDLAFHLLGNLCFIPGPLLPSGQSTTCRTSPAHHSLTIPQRHCPFQHLCLFVISLFLLFSSLFRKYIQGSPT